MLVFICVVYVCVCVCVCACVCVCVCVCVCACACACACSVYAPIEITKNYIMQIVTRNTLVIQFSGKTSWLFSRELFYNMFQAMMAGERGGGGGGTQTLFFLPPKT